MRLLKRLRAPIDQFGLVAGLLYLIDRVFGVLTSGHVGLRVYELMVQPVPESESATTGGSGGVEIREICRGDPEVELMPASASAKTSRFDQGAVCLGAFRREELIGYIWLCFDQYEEDEARCTYQLSPRRQAVFDFDLYIFPKHRIGRSFSRLWQGANEYLGRRNVRYSFSRVTRFNTGSLRAHARLGAVRVARALFFQAWGLEIMFATVAPFLYVSVRHNSRVTLRLTPDVLHVGQKGRV